MTKILVVDDDAGLRGLYEEILKSEGFEVVTAVSGQEGLKRMNEDKYDLVLLDMMMPVMSGMDFLSKRTDKTTPVLVMTNLDREAVVEEVTAAGAVGCLSKVEANPEQFVEKVKSYLPPAK